MSDRPFRVLPRITPLTEPFWTGGAQGALRVLRCVDDGTWIHPPAPVCPRCLGREVVPADTSGRGFVHSFTVNHQAWNPTMPTPYVIALVELEEGVRLVTNLVGVDPDDVEIGLPVEVVFERHDEVWVPLFTPASAGGDA